MHRVAVLVELTVDGSAAESETWCEWRDPGVLVVATALREQKREGELHSQFFGARAMMNATHFVTGSLARPPATTTAEHEAVDVGSASGARCCVYEHLHALGEVLASIGRRLTADMYDDAFDGLDRFAASR